MDGIDIGHLHRDPGRRHFVVADDGRSTPPPTAPRDSLTARGSRRRARWRPTRRAAAAQAPNDAGPQVLLGHRLFPEPRGFEGLGGVEVLLRDDHSSVLQEQHKRVVLDMRRAAGGAATDDLVEDHDAVAEVDDLRRSHAVVTPRTEPFAEELDEAFVPAIARPEDVRLRQDARGAKLGLWVVAEQEGPEIPAVERLGIEPDSARQQRLPDTRGRWQLAEETSARIGQRWEAQRKPLIERSVRLLAHSERLADDALVLLRHRPPSIPAPDMAALAGGQPALQSSEDTRLLGPNRPLLAQRQTVGAITPTTSPSSAMSSQYRAAGSSNGGAGRWQRRHADVGSSLRRSPRRRPTCRDCRRSSQAGLFDDAV